MLKYLGKITLLLFIISIITPFNKINAASDGTLGATSTATSNISVFVPFNVQITSVDDIALGNWLSTSGDLSGVSEVCIYSNGSSGYTVTASSGNGSGSFVMQRTSDSATVNYTVKWFTTTGVTYASGGGTLLN